MNATQTPAIERPSDGDALDPDQPVASVARRRSLASRLRWPIGTTLFLHVFMAVNDRLPSVDGLAYFEAGRNFIGGHGYVRLDRAELHFPPVTPVGLAVLEKLTGTEMRALGIWNVSWGMAVVIGVVLLARRLYDDDSVTVAAAWFAGTMAGLGPLFFRSGGGSEAPSAALLLFAGLLTIDGLRTSISQTRHRVSFLMAAGALVGLAYLTRPESLLPGAAIGFAILGWSWRDGRANGFRLERPVIDAGAYGLTILLFVFPYVAFLHGHNGSWSPTAKTQDVSIGAWKDVAENDRLDRDRILYAVDKTGIRLQEGTTSLTALARAHPGEWVQILGINARTSMDDLIFPSLGFGPAWAMIPIIPLLAAAAELWRTRRRGSTKLLGAMAAMPVVTCLLFFTLPRYLVITTAVLSVFAAAGFVRWRRALPPTAGRALLAVTVVVMATSFLTGAQSYVPGIPTADPIDQAATGRWLEANTPPGSRVMTRSYHVQGYADRPIVAMPSTDYVTMLKFARRMGVSYIVADAGTLRYRRPELYGALMTNWQPPGLKLVHILGGKKRPVRIYVLDPLPPPSDRPPIYLGYVSD
ncbi:MAG: hypothetical protein JWM89_3442 [Acidimicrobiales bacterium]|nr:hypothetical protein [Acidimicrobiales bacterium]